MYRFDKVCGTLSNTSGTYAGFHLLLNKAAYIGTTRVLLLVSVVTYSYTYLKVL